MKFESAKSQLERLKKSYIELKIKYEYQEKILNKLREDLNERSRN
jgi:hypothetical protein